MNDFESRLLFGLIVKEIAEYDDMNRSRKEIARMLDNRKLKGVSPWQEMRSVIMAVTKEEALTELLLLAKGVGIGIDIKSLLGRGYTSGARESNQYLIKQLTGEANDTRKKLKG